MRNQAWTTVYEACIPIYRQSKPLLSYYSRPLFRRGIGVQESKQEVTNIVSLVKNGEKFTDGILSL